MNNIFGTNLRRLRAAKKYTQEQAAQLLNISPKSLSRWECGSTMPDVMILPEIARLYGVLIDDLYKESPEGYENYAARLMAVYEASGKHEDFMAAALEYEKMVKADNMTPNDYRNYGLIHNYMSTNCMRKAMECYDKSMALCKETDTELYYRVKRQKNMLRAQRGEGQACIEEQRKMIQDDPENAEEYTCLAAALYEEKQYEECYLVTKDAIAKFPQEAMLYIYAGDCCRELRKYDEAFAYWEKHQELEPKWLDSRYSMGFCYEEIGEYKKAYEVWMKLAKILTERGGVIEAEWPKKMAERCKEKISN